MAENVVPEDHASQRRVLVTRIERSEADTAPVPRAPGAGATGCRWWMW